MTEPELSRPRKKSLLCTNSITPEYTNDPNNNNNNNNPELSHHDQPELSHHD